MSRRRKFTFPILMTTVLGGGGALNISNPATDTFYTASANGTFTLDLTQPGSTLPLTRIGFYYRATTSSDAWFYYIERNAANTAWDLKRSLIQSGTPTVTTITTGVGAVAALRVTVSGTSHVFESSADGESWTSRGSTTSAVHQTNTKVAAHYTGAVGSQLLSNSDFSAWTGDNPNSWAVNSETGSDFITENANGARYVNAIGGAVSMSQAYTSAADKHIMVGEIYSAVGSANITAAVITPFTGILSMFSVAIFAARYTRTGNGTVVLSRAAPGVNTDAVIRRVEVYAIGTLDDGGTTGPTRLYAA